MKFKDYYPDKVIEDKHLRSVDCATILVAVASVAFANHWLWESSSSATDVYTFCVIALATNTVLISAICGFRVLIIKPALRIVHHCRLVYTTFSPTQVGEKRSGFRLSRLTSDLARFATLMIDYHRQQQELARELSEAQKIIAQFAMHQDTMLDSTSREIGTQYRAVLAYANYLEEQIMRNRLDPMMRYDFDEVCESSFNLKLIAGALAMLTVETPPHVTHISVADIMQRTMFSLAPALDRRAMKLTTAEVDLFVMARGDPGYIAHILWMMMLGLIRYAADESTLRMRSFYNHDETRAMMSIVVSELAPQQLSEQERGDHLARQLQQVTPHMFAETISIHGNIQLAHLLTERMGGSIRILPLTASSCEICMELPAALPEDFH